jgi:predicted RNase H-like HicB family nuclease
MKWSTPVRIFNNFTLQTKEMKIKREIDFTAIIEKEGDGYVSLCPELDIASQGFTVEEAGANLNEAIELYFEMASESEISNRLHEDVFVTRVHISI